MKSIAMYRFLFSVKARGGFDPTNINRIRIPSKDKPISTQVIISAGTIDSAKKKARKQHDGTFWLIGFYTEDNTFVKMSNLTLEQKIAMGGTYEQSKE